MRTSVLSVVDEYQTTFEGRVQWMYLDVRELVTVGVGNLIDPVTHALGLPFRRKDGTEATPQEIREEWLKVKGAGELAPRGHRAFSELAKLRLTNEDIDALVENTARAYECELEGMFPAWHAWPASSQLGMLGVCWAVGAGKVRIGFPRFMEACKRQDWTTAARECLINTLGNPGIVPRNQANRRLFLAAAAGGDPELVGTWKASELS